MKRKAFLVAHKRKVLIYGLFVGKFGSFKMTFVAKCLKII